MPTLITVTRTPFGPRLHLLGKWRVHHGAIGLLALAAGALLVATDWHDRPWPLRDPLLAPWQ